jgi:hypothetical protein
MANHFEVWYLLQENFPHFDLDFDLDSLSKSWTANVLWEGHTRRMHHEDEKMERLKL